MKFHAQVTSVGEFGKKK